MSSLILALKFLINDLDMDQSQALQELILIVSSVVGHNDFTLEIDSTADSVRGWDSLSHVQILHRCEMKWGLKLSLDELASLSTVGDLLAAIQKHCAS